jgi:microcystin-dependent protein
MPVFRWSRTSSANATADPTVGYSEGQAPSSLNDSARAAMAAVAMYRDDISGAIVTSGVSTAYTVASYSSYTTLAFLDGQMIAFTPHTTNGTPVSLNVDSLGAKPLRSAPNVELLAGTLIQGTPYTCTYNNADGAFYLHGLSGNPYNIPLGGGLPYVGTTAPNSSFVFPFGQAISRTTYATMFSLVSTTFGAGDGSTTFNLPDFRGRFLAGADNMGGVAAGRLTSASSMGTGLLGQVGGGETETLTLAQLPTGITSANPAAIGLTVTSGSSVVGGSLAGALVGAGGASAELFNPGTAFNVAPISTGTIAIGAASVTSNNTSGNAHPIVPPTAVVNFILRIV